jgi:hypothetical protein
MADAPPKMTGDRACWGRLPNPNRPGKPGLMKAAASRRTPNGCRGRALRNQDLTRAISSLKISNFRWEGKADRLQAGLDCDARHRAAGYTRDARFELRNGNRGTRVSVRDGGLGTRPTRYFEALEGASAGARTWAMVRPGENFSFTSNLRYSMEPG